MTELKFGGMQEVTLDKITQTTPKLSFYHVLRLTSTNLKMLGGRGGGGGGCCEKLITLYFMCEAGLEKFFYPRTFTLDVELLNLR